MSTPKSVTQELLGLARYASEAKPSKSVVIDRLQRVIASLKGPRQVTASNRRYRDADTDAVEIASEVVARGRSRGWGAQDEDQLKIAAQIEEVLGKFNIGYTDDMYGDWEWVRGGSKFFR